MSQPGQEGRTDGMFSRNPVTALNLPPAQPASCSELRRYFNWLSRADTLTLSDTLLTDVCLDVTMSHEMSYNKDRRVVTFCHIFP